MEEKHILQNIFEQYNFPQAQTRLLGSLWNRVYHVDAGGLTYSLRLCPSVIQNKQVVEDELRWLEFVADSKQVQVPRPVRNKLLTNSCYPL